MEISTELRRKVFPALVTILILLIIIPGCYFFGRLEEVPINMNPLLSNEEILNNTNAESIVRELSQEYARKLNFNGSVIAVAITNRSGGFTSVVINKNNSYVSIKMYEATAIFDENNTIIFRFTAPYINHYRQINYTLNDTYYSFLNGNTVCFSDSNCFLVEEVGDELNCKTKIDLLDLHNTVYPNIYSNAFSNDSVIYDRKVKDPVLTGIFKCLCNRRGISGDYDYEFSIDSPTNQGYDPADPTSFENFEKKVKQCNDKFYELYGFYPTSDHGPWISDKDTEFKCEYYVSFSQKQCMITSLLSLEYINNTIYVESPIEFSGLKLCNKEFHIDKGRTTLEVPPKCRNKCIKIYYQKYQIAALNCRYRG